MIATKVYGDMGDWPNTNRLSALHIRRKACEDSLRRLKTDYIDVYQMHHVWRDAPWEEIWQAMDLLVQQGKVLYVGSSNFAGWHIAQANEAAKSRNSLGLVSEQSIYHLLNRNIEQEVLPACKFYGLGVIPWSPLAGGLLGGVLQKATEGRRSSMTEDRGREKPSETGSVGKSVPRTSAKSPPTWRWRGCSRIQRLPRRLSGRARWSSSKAPCERWKFRFRRRPTRNSMKSFRARRPHRKNTHGEVPGIRD